MNTFPHAGSQPLSLSASTESQTYALTALALGLSLMGAYIGMANASLLIGSGIQLLFLGAQIILIMTANWWMRQTPLNYVLFAVFPFLSGLAIAPYILYILAGYANGGAIVLNALASTIFMTAAAAVLARLTGWNLSVMGRALFLSVLGLFFFGLLQMFIPALRGRQIEIIFSGIGIVVFGLFTAYDLQRISEMGRYGANPMMLALSLFLDIFNLFLYILRFMVAISGNRR